MGNFFCLPENTKACFPRHGWTRNITGSRQLRLPLLRLFQFESPHYEIFNANGLAGIWLQCHSPSASLRMLAVCLRDISSEFQIILATNEEDWDNRPVSDERNRSLTRNQEAMERSEVLLISAFVLLRRLADQIMDAARPLLFEDWKSAPRQMKTAVSMARSGRISELQARCNSQRLIDALVSKTAWFDAFRQEDGVRDILVHKEHFLSVGSLGTKPTESADYSWRVTVDLMRVKNGEIANLDIMPVLRTCLEGLCDFMEAVYLSLNEGGDYAIGDTVFVTGNDDDVTAFWPSIERQYRR